MIKPVNVKPGLNVACVASVSVRFGSKELQGDKWCDSPFFARAKR